MPTDGYLGGIAAGPDGALWFTDTSYPLDTHSFIWRAPDCALGFSAGFSGTNLTMNFLLGIDTPAMFRIYLRKSTGPYTLAFSKMIPSVVPPRAFTMTWSPFPDLGEVTVRARVGNTAGRFRAGSLLRMDDCEHGITVSVGQPGALGQPAIRQERFCCRESGWQIRVIGNCRSPLVSDKAAQRALFGVRSSGLIAHSPTTIIRLTCGEPGQNAYSRSCPMAAPRLALGDRAVLNFVEPNTRSHLAR